MKKSIKHLHLFLFFFFLQHQLVAQEGSLDPSFNPGFGPDNTVNSSIVQADGKIIISGNFTHYDGYPVNQIARIFPDGRLDHSFVVPPDPMGSGFVDAMAFDSDENLIFSRLLNNGVPRLSRVNSSGAYYNNYFMEFRAYDYVKDIHVQANDAIFVGGWLTRYNAGGYPRKVTKLVSLKPLYGDFYDTYYYGVNLLQSEDTTQYVSSIGAQNNTTCIIAGNFTMFYGTAANKILRVYNNGHTIDPSFTPPNFSGSIEHVLVQQDGKILVSGNFINPGRFLARLNADGTLDNTFNAGNGISGSNSTIHAMVEQSDGKIIIAGVFTSYNGVAVTNIARLNPDGSLDQTFDSGTGPNSYIKSLGLLPDGSIFISGGFTSYNGFAANRIARLINGKYVIGQVFFDLDSNCTQATGEYPVYGRSMTIQPGNISLTTNQNGCWYVDSLPAGTYTISADTSDGRQFNCGNSKQFTVLDPTRCTIVSPFGMNTPVATTKPVASIHSNTDIEYCVSNHSVNLRVGNEIGASAAISNAKTLITMYGTSLSGANLLNTTDPVSYSSVTSPNPNERTYLINHGTLIPGKIFDIELKLSTGCTNLYGKTFYVSAKLQSADSTYLDTLADLPPFDFTPCTGVWDHSDLSVTGSCVNNNIVFTVKNNGPAGVGDMQCYRPVRVFLADKYLFLDSVLLAGGSSRTFTYSGDARFWRMEVYQHPLYPGNSKPSCFVEQCGSGIFNFRSDQALIYPVNDANPNEDLYCYKPTSFLNQNSDFFSVKGLPLGQGPDHLIPPNTELEYILRFYNIGPDTVTQAVVRDTLEYDLDSSSITLGASSHRYQFRLLSPRVLEWTFSDLNIPPSTAYTKSSAGFVKFYVKQMPDLPDGTQIKNAFSVVMNQRDPLYIAESVHTVDRQNNALIRSKDTISLNSCGMISYNGFDYFRSGTYYQVKTGDGLDSMLTLLVTIHSSTSSIIRDTVCETYTAPDGNVYTTSGNYTAIIPNAAGCDSTITIRLVVYNAMIHDSLVSACDSFTDPYGRIFTTSGIYDTLFQSYQGCDSIVRYSLTIRQTPSILSTTPAINCGPGTYDLEAQADGGVPSWFDAPSGGNLLGTGSNFTSPLILESSTFYVSAINNGCESNRVAVTASTDACTQLKSWYCERYLTNFNEYMACDLVPGATSYRFLIDDGLEQFHYENPTGGMRFSLIPGIKYGTFYTVKVAAQINGVWMNYGEACNVKTPPTTMKPWYCNLTVNPMSQYLACYPVSGATQYKFKLVNGQTTLYYTSNGIGFRMNWVPGIQTNTTYDVSVSSYANGLWSNYGPACSITSAASMQANQDSGNDYFEGDETIVEENPEISVQPNPTSGVLTVISNFEGEFYLTNELGQVLQVIQIRPENVFREQIEIPDNGVYFIKGIHNNQSVCKKVIVIH